MVVSLIITVGKTRGRHARSAGPVESLQFFEESEDFITVTPFEYEPKDPEEAWMAVGSLIGAILAVLTLGLPISIGFLTGVVAMVLGGVLTIEEAYRAIEWKVTFLIAGLIPIGIAMETPGAAAFIADNFVMSNVAATVLMVPLVLELTGIGGSAHRRSSCKSVSARQTRSSCPRTPSTPCS